jgi:hypothetical protein
MDGIRFLRAVLLLIRVGFPDRCLVNQELILVHHGASGKFSTLGRSCRGQCSISQKVNGINASVRRRFIVARFSRDVKACLLALLVSVVWLSFFPGRT